MGYLGGQHGPILSVRDFPSGEKGKNGVKHRRAKRVQRWTGEEETALFPPQTSSPLPSLADCFFLFFPHCEPDLRLGYPALVPQKSSLFGHIINPSLTSLFGQDGWTLASSLIPTLSRSIKQQKRTWPMSSYLDLLLDQ